MIGPDSIERADSDFLAPSVLYMHPQSSSHHREQYVLLTAIGPPILAKVTCYHVPDAFSTPMVLSVLRKECGIKILLKP